MTKKVTVISLLFILLGFNIHTQAQTAYVYNAAQARYGTIDLLTGEFTSLDFLPQGNLNFIISGDNNGINEQYTVVVNSAFTTFHLIKINFATLTSDSIGVIAPLAAGQKVVKAIAHNALTNTWYVISQDDFGSAAYLYTIDISTGVLTTVGKIQNADAPVTLAIDCNGNAYIVNLQFGLMSNTAVLNSLDLTTAAATAIGSDIGLEGASLSIQDMDFDPVTDSLYWTAYWQAGFFGGGGSLRLVNVTTGSSTEIKAYLQFENLAGFSINGTCAAVPVEMTSFTVTTKDNSVSLNWSTATESNNSGFQVERKDPSSEWMKIGFVPGAGSTTETKVYSFTDNPTGIGTYVYRLKQIDMNGDIKYSEEVEVSIGQPNEYTLSQNYPNPFNPSTNIKFAVPQAGNVSLKIYNAMGEELTNLVSSYYEAGSYQVTFNASGYSSGIYFVTMESGSFRATKKITLMK